MGHGAPAGGWGGRGGGGPRCYVRGDTRAHAGLEEGWSVHGGGGMRCAVPWAPLDANVGERRRRRRCEGNAQECGAAGGAGED
eukprot:gene16561-biopygen8264